MTRPLVTLLSASLLVHVAGCAMGAPLDSDSTTDGSSTGGSSSGSSTTDADTDAPEEPSNPKPEEARSFFEKYCAKCHGQGSAGNGNINYITDLVALVENDLVVPNDPDASRLFKRLTDTSNPMPPANETNRPSEDEIATIREWIADGALAGEGACVNDLIGFDDMFRVMRDDLFDHFEEVTDRQNIRYLTLTHLHNAGMCDRDLDVYRQAVTKGVNSLSLRSQLVVPEPIDDQATIFRIDLRDYGWDNNPNFVNADLWDTIAGVNPFAVPFRDGAADDVRAQTGTAVPFQPADSFLQIATGGVLSGVDTTEGFYYKILQLPATLPQLEVLPFINVPDRAKAIDDGEAFRVIVTESGVSAHNRAYDRYEGSSFGAYYYRSFDFAGEDGDRNLFNNPTDFVADGGEMIFTLPNGLQGYAISDAADQLIREAPTNVVKDPGQRDAVVRAGISCMSCHSVGIIPKRDTFYDFFEKVEGNFIESERDLIEKLMSDPDGSEKRQEADSVQFKSLLAGLGITQPSPDPVTLNSQQFEANLSLERVAAELGMTADDLKFEFGGLDNAFDKLRIGNMSRDELTVLFRSSICILLPGEDVIPDCVPG